MANLHLTPLRKRILGIQRHASRRHARGEAREGFARLMDLMDEAILVTDETAAAINAERKARADAEQAAKAEAEQGKKKGKKGKGTSEATPEATPEEATQAA